MYSEFLKNYREKRCVIWILIIMVVCKIDMSKIIEIVFVVILIYGW